MNNENLKPVQELTPFTKMIMTIGTLPTSFYASLSYYESMVWLYEYLKNEVIPAVNNNGEAVEELQTAFTTLQNWIEHYFDNLDLQQEVNTKLDEMALDGTLTNLIKDYVDPIYGAYETRINEQVNSQNETITNFELNVNQSLSNYNNKINSLFNYSPIPVSSTSDMTDTSKIYVNTSNGKWYYYDGDSWEIGGTYQSSSNDDILNNESTNAVQNKVITNAVNNVLDIINETDDAKICIDCELTDGYVDTAGNITSSTSYQYSQKIAVQEGDILTPLSRTGSGSFRFVTAYTDDTAVPASGSSSGVSSYTVPENINYVIVSATAKQLVSVLIEREDVSYQTIKDNKTEDRDMYSIINITLSLTPGLVATNGVVSPSDSYSYTQKIEVQPGDIIIPYKLNNDDEFRILTAYRNNMPLNDYGDTHLQYYEVPYPINYVIASIYNNTITNVFIVRKEKALYYKNTKLGNYIHKGNINEELSFDYNNIGYEFNYDFSSKITTFDKLSFGLTDLSTDFTPFLEIDNTKVYYKFGNENREIEHNLTINNHISIKIESNNNAPNRLNLSIYSNGELFTNDNTPMSYIYPNGKPTVKINNSVLYDTVFSFTPKNINKDIWLFGDSWLSYDSARMPYYLIQNKNDNNVLINQYSGEGSVNGLTSLTNLLKLHKPRYLLWLYGMNDSDTSTSVNSNWFSSLQSVIELCKANNIELILATIPNTTSQIMKYKNAVVRNSGYRYVDQEACLTNTDGTWITGYQDGNHPTALGAKALYYRFISDVPELLNN